MSEFNNIIKSCILQLRRDGSNFMQWKYQVPLLTKAKIFKDGITFWDIINYTVGNLSESLLDDADHDRLFAEVPAETLAATTQAVAEAQAVNATPQLLNAAAGAKLVLERAVQSLDLFTIRFYDTAGRRVITNSEYNVANNVALVLLVETVHSDLWTEMNDPYARNLWMKLNNRFNSANTTSTVAIHKKIYVRYQGVDESATDYGSALRQLIDEHNNLVQPIDLISDGNAARVLLSNADTTRYGMIFASLKTNNIPLNYTHVLQLMIEYDQEHPRPQSTVVYVGTKRTDSSSKTSYNASYNPNKGKYNGKRNESETVECRYCKKPNHIANECRKKQRDEKRKSSSNQHSRNKHFNRSAKSYNGNEKSYSRNNRRQQQNEVSSDDDRPHNRSYVASIVNDRVLLASGRSNDIKFVIDTGAALHIIGTRNFLHDYEPVDSFQVEGFNSEPLSVIGKGSLNFRYNHNGASLTCKLNNVHYIEGIDFNILSVSCLSERNKLKFNSKGISVVCHGHEIITAVIERRLYVATLNLIPVKDNAANVSTHTFGVDSNATTVTMAKRAVSSHRMAPPKRAKPTDVQPVAHPSTQLSNDLFNDSDEMDYISELQAQDDASPSDVTQSSTDSHVQKGTSSITSEENDSQQILPASTNDSAPSQHSHTSVTAVDADNAKSQAILWHKRLGHSNMRSIRYSVAENAITDVPRLSHAKIVCEPCIQAKQVASSHTTPATRAKSVLELIHIDIGFCGEVSLERHECYLVIVDDYSRYVKVIPMVQKSDSFARMKEFFAWIDTHCDAKTKVKRVRSDNALEFVAIAFKDFYSKRGIEHQLTSHYSPQQNGVAERMNRTLKETTRALLIQSQQNNRLWHHALQTAAYIRNHLVGSSSMLDQTPAQIFMHEGPPSLKHLRVWGCVAWVKHLDDKKLGKLASRSDKCVFIGYTLTPHNWRVMSIETGTVYEHNNVKFIEHQFVTMDTSRLKRYFIPPRNDSVGDVVDKASSVATSRSPTFPFLPLPADVSLSDEVVQPVGALPQSATSTVKAPSSSVEVLSPPVGEDVVMAQSDEASTNNSSPFPAKKLVIKFGGKTVVNERLKEKHGTSLHHLLSVMSLTVTDTEPLTYKQAVASRDSADWKKAMDSEISSLNKHNTGTLIKRPIGANILDNRWVYRIKRDADGNPVKMRARLVVRGFMQKYGYDFWDTYAPTVRISTVLIVLAIVAFHDMELHQMDVDTAFLYGKLDEDVYMEQPEGYVDEKHPNHVWKLNKSLYGLKQAPLQWYKEINAFFTEVLHFTRVEHEYGLYTYIAHGIHCIVCLYVDDMLLACNNLKFLRKLKVNIGTKWSVKDIGEAKFMLGMNISRDRKCKQLYINQSTYIKTVLERFRMFECRTMSTPASAVQLKKPDESEVSVDIPYRKATGSLIYLCYTRPDVQYAVGQVCKHNNSYGKPHWAAVKHILRYLRGTIDQSLRFDGTKPLRLTAYCDADFAMAEDNRRSYSGYTMYLGNSLISWSSKQQSVTAQSTTEAEYMAMSHAMKDVCYLRFLLTSLGAHQSKPTKLYCDNRGAIDLTANPIHHSRTKHIDYRYHRIRDEIERGTLVVDYVSTHDNPADVLTKSLGLVKHQRAIQLLGMSP